jgi:hypothetical protein
VQLDFVVIIIRLMPSPRFLRSPIQQLEQQRKIIHPPIKLGRQKVFIMPYIFNQQRAQAPVKPLWRSI